MTRAGLLLEHLATVRANGNEPIPAAAIGLLQDLGFPLYVATPLALHLLLGPRKARRRPIMRSLSAARRACRRVIC